MRNRKTDESLLLFVENGEVKIKSQNVNLYNMIRMCGVLQVFVGICCIDKQGMDLDEVRNNFLDIHLAAMETVEASILHRKGGNNG